MNNLGKLSGSIVLASLLFSGCSSNSESTQSSTYSAEENVIVNESINNTKRNLQRELVQLSNQRSVESASLGSVIAAFIEDDLSSNEGSHYNANAAREFFTSAEIDVSALSDTEVSDLMVYSYIGAISATLGVEDVEVVQTTRSKRRVFGIGSKIKKLVKKGTDKVKDKIVDVVDDSKILSGITNEVFKVMLKSGKMTNEMLRLAVKSKTIAEIMITVMDDHWGLAEQMQPLLENNVAFGHLFMDLAQAHDYMVADFLFGRIDGPMYYSLTKAMTLSRENVGNGSAGKTTRVLSELMAMPRMAKFFNVPSTLEYTDGQSVEAFSKLLFSNGTAERGDGNEFANERFFYEIFATPESTANFIIAMNNIDEDTRLALMDQIFMGESKFAPRDETQSYYNIYAIAGGMAYGLGIGAANFEAYKPSFEGFYDLVPASRFLGYGQAFAAAGYSYYSDDNQAYIENFQGLISGTILDFNSEAYDYTTWLDFDEEGLDKETVIERFYKFVLNRAPDAKGKVANLEAFDTTDITVLADNFIIGAEAELLINDEDGVFSDEEFIKGLYIYGLNRAPDQEGLTNWLSQLQSGMSRGTVLLAFINSEEAGGDSLWDDAVRSYDDIDYTTWLDFDEDALENETIVDRFYQFILAREADEEGKAGYLNALNTQEDGVVAADFVQNAEAETGVQSNTEFVSALYTNGLKREADAEGLAYWVAELDAGTNTRANVLLSFINSDEIGGDSYYDQIGNYVDDFFGETYDDIYITLSSYYNDAKEEVSALFNNMTFDAFYDDDNTKIQYFVSNSTEVETLAVTYSDDEYTATKLYGSSDTWAYIPNKWAEQDWISASDTSYLDMNFSFSSGYVTGYVVSPLDLAGLQEALPAITFVKVELNGDEPLSTNENAVYNIYSVELAKDTNLRLEWSTLSTSTVAVFFNTDTATANSSIIEK